MKNNSFRNYAGAYTVAGAQPSERSMFIRRTYLHLAGALITLIMLEALLLQTAIGARFTGILVKHPMSWAIVLGVFFLVSHIANKWAMSEHSPKLCYLGLGVYIIAQGLILLPLLYYAQMINAEAIPIAGTITIGLFLALTFVAFFTKKDFSFMGKFLSLAFIIAAVAIFASIFFKFTLGIWFAAAMCLLIGGNILYTTSNIIHHYNPRQHVAASLALFASVATLFWYVLRIVLAFTNRD